MAEQIASNKSDSITKTLIKSHLLARGFIASRATGNPILPINVGRTWPSEMRNYDIHNQNLMKWSRLGPEWY
jgi:hypothetical protein